MPPLFFFYQQTWQQRLFWRLRLRGIAGWLWRLPQAKQKNLCIDKGEEILGKATKLPVMLTLTMALKQLRDRKR
jgi:hypothetical protein